MNESTNAHLSAGPRHHLHRTCFTIMNLCLILTLPSVSMAGSIHAHCDIKDWNTSSSSTFPVVPFDYHTGTPGEITGGLLIEVPLNSDPPPSSMDCCLYETSDITLVKITANFTGNMVWDTIDFGGANGTRWDGPFTWQSGVSKTFSFQQHQGTNPNLSGPIEESIGPATLPFNIILMGNNHDFTLTGVTVEVFGHHYYLPDPKCVPEPSTFVILSSLVGMAYFRRKNLTHP